MGQVPLGTGANHHHGSARLGCPHHRCRLPGRRPRGGPAAAKAAAFAGDGGWDGLLSVATAVSTAAGLLAFGIVHAWSFGREFSEGTITGLFALPTTRTMVAGAKLLVLCLWVFASTMVLTGVAVLLGAVLGYEPTADTFSLAARLAGSTFLTGALAVVGGLVASICRSMLAGIGSAIVMPVLAQVAVLLGLGGWFPFAAPGVWAATVTGGGVFGIQLAALLVMTAGAASATVYSWHRLRL
ncbi:ABC transporter permease [Arthrobacter sp. H35-D1]|uniref:ABC transporter permease n=1 Tax=Arthrobacter sp. H35-D1 TaxID=3046202 RepID=UPI0024BB2C09|nr:ABC transporter permease [Arthrobacter sp. H35-D1]MDJ0314819.1 ABC transporter permease [Arthrobacter sp. H35-D1]